MTYCSGLIYIASVVSLKHSLRKQYIKVFNAISMVTLRHNTVTLGGKKSQTSVKRHENVNL